MRPVADHAQVAVRVGCLPSLQRRHALAVCDAREEATATAVAKGAQRADTPAEVSNRCETVLVSLPTPDVVRAVALGPDGLVQGTALRTYIDLSTTGAVMAKTIAAGLSEKDIATLDSPVSGGILGAESGKLSLMVSGPHPPALSLACLRRSS